MHFFLIPLFLWALYKWPRQVFFMTTLALLGFVILVTTDAREATRKQQMAQAAVDCVVPAKPAPGTARKVY